VIVHVAIKGIESNSSEILGVFFNEEPAIECCLQQKTFTRTSWVKKENNINYWHNDSGLYVRVLKFNVY
jgi:hypothetical protein